MQKSEVNEAAPLTLDKFIGQKGIDHVIYNRSLT
jgi:hypothetical protein